ncbi:MAG TPA: hypothetical protein VGP68_22200 [Gemmataceae bacterium]|nr:hypothetical protein [Gemmataceae bacterium]
MAHYVQTYIENMIAKKEFSAHYFNELYQELLRFDPRDFEPAVQALLVSSRVRVRYLAQANRRDPQRAQQELESVMQVFDHYKGVDSKVVFRIFTFIADPVLKLIIERDYGELKLRLYPTGSWKSAVVMAGSILEAILFDRLYDPKWNAKALHSSRVPTYNSKPKKMARWTLENLINIAVDIKMLPTETANTIHQVLRDYRNFVHPKKEVRSLNPCGESEAMLSVGALDSVCNYIEKNP